MLNCVFDRKQNRYGQPIGLSDAWIIRDNPHVGSLSGIESCIKGLLTKNNTIL